MKSKDGLYLDGLAVNLFPSTSFEEELMKRRGGALSKLVGEMNNKTTWFFDKVLRLNMFRYFRDELGYEPFDAAESANRYLIDYSLQYMPAANRNIVRQIFPFYAWMSGNIKLHATEFATNPAVYLNRWRMLEAWNIGNSGHDMESNPQGYLNRVAMGEGPAGKEIYVTRSLMPTMWTYDWATRFWQFGPLGILQWFGYRLSPLVKGTSGILTGQFKQSNKAMQQGLGERLHALGYSTTQTAIDTALNQIWGLQQPIKVFYNTVEDARKNGIPTALGRVPFTPENYYSMLGLIPLYYPSDLPKADPNDPWFKVLDKHLLHYVSY